MDPRGDQKGSLERLSLLAEDIESWIEEQKRQSPHSNSDSDGEGGEAQ
jgi:hypothetical protein